MQSQVNLLQAGVALAIIVSIIIAIIFLRLGTASAGNAVAFLVTIPLRVQGVLKLIFIIMVGAIIKFDYLLHLAFALAIPLLHMLLSHT